MDLSGNPVPVILLLVLAPALHGGYLLLHQKRTIAETPVIFFVYLL